MTNPIFTIDEFIADEPVNPYAEIVQALADAGEGRAATITVKRGIRRDRTYAEGERDRLLFQQAANAIGYTARARKLSATDDKSMVAVTFTLTKLHARAGVPRKRKSDDSVAESIVSAESDSESVSDDAMAFREDVMSDVEESAPVTAKPVAKPRARKR